MPTWGCRRARTISSTSGRSRRKMTRRLEYPASTIFAPKLSRFTTITYPSSARTRRATFRPISPGILRLSVITSLALPEPSVKPPRWKQQIVAADRDAFAQRLRHQKLRGAHGGKQRLSARKMRRDVRGISAPGTVRIGVRHPWRGDSHHGSFGRDEPVDRLAAAQVAALGENVRPLERPRQRSRRRAQLPFVFNGPAGKPRGLRQIRGDERGAFHETTKRRPGPGGEETPAGAGHAHRIDNQRHARFQERPQRLFHRSHDARSEERRV